MKKKPRLESNLAVRLLGFSGAEIAAELEAGAPLPKRMRQAACEELAKLNGTADDLLSNHHLNNNKESVMQKVRWTCGSGHTELFIALPQQQPLPPNSVHVSVPLAGAAIAAPITAPAITFKPMEEQPFDEFNHQLHNHQSRSHNHRSHKNHRQHHNQPNHHNQHHNQSHRHHHQRQLHEHLPAQQIQKRQQQVVTMEDFELLKVLGAGAYGKVFLVRKLTSHDKGKLYAMKVLSTEVQPQNTKSLDHTRTERKVLEAIRGEPFLVTMHYAFQTKTKLHLILDYVNGGELFTHLYQKDHFVEDDAKIYIGELILALEKLHQVSTFFIPF